MEYLTKLLNYLILGCALVCHDRTPTSGRRELAMVLRQVSEAAAQVLDSLTFVFPLAARLVLYLSKLGVQTRSGALVLAAKSNLI
jgi:hypothetical protein